MKKLLFIPFVLISIALITSCKCKTGLNSTEETTSNEHADSLLAGLDTQVDIDTLFSVYQRTACFGRCPVLKLSLYKSGLMVYEAIKWAEPEGLWFAWTDEATMSEIMATAEDIDFFSLDDEYDQSNVTDLPSTLYTINKGGNHKKIKARYQAPEELKQLQAKFDALIAAHSDWLPYRDLSQER
jgi:hypothetical protein